MSRSSFNAGRHAAGLSLIEMMIAMVISLILMLGVVQIFMASRAASRLSEGAARTQENARFALDFLERDIRMAGHMGMDQVTTRNHPLVKIDPEKNLLLIKGALPGPNGALLFIRKAVTARVKAVE